MIELTKKEFWSMTIAGFCSMCIEGLLDGMKSVTFPLMKTYFDADYVMFGVLNSMVNIGYVIFAFLSSILIPYIGFKNCMIICGISGLLLSVCMAYSPSFIWCIIIQFFFGISLGFGDIPPQTLGAYIFTKNPGFYMSLVNAFYGLGTLLGPMYSGFILLYVPYGYTGVYLLMLIPVFILTVIICVAKFRVFSLDDDKNKEKQKTTTSVSEQSYKPLEQQSSEKSCTDSVSIQDKVVFEEACQEISHSPVNQTNVLNTESVYNQAVEPETLDTIIKDITIQKQESTSSIQKGKIIPHSSSLSSHKSSVSVEMKRKISDQDSSLTLSKDIPDETLNHVCISIKEEPEPQKKCKLNPSVAALLNPYVILFTVTLTMLTLVERSGMNWSGLYVEDVLHLDSSKEGAMFNTIYFSLYTVTRLFGGVITDKLGAMNTIYACLSITMVFLLIGYSTGVVGFWIICSTGIFVSLFWPSLIIVATEYFDEIAPLYISVILPMQSFISSIMQPLLGSFNTWWGPEWAFRFTFVFACIALVLLLNISCLIHKKKNKAIKSEI